METKLRNSLLLCFMIMLATPIVTLALDEAVLTPTSKTVVAEEDSEFQAAMTVWKSHKYEDGQKLLKDFADKHPRSRWAAEALLHCGCGMYYKKQYDDAKKIFVDLLSKHENDNIGVKAKIRLGNIAEKRADIKEAIRNYSDVLQMSPTWDQFKYANYRARVLVRKQQARQALINCGPVALAACLSALGRPAEANTARALEPGENGVSIAQLITYSESFGIPAQAVELPFDKLRSIELPMIVYLKPNHYAAVLSVNGDRVSVEDSLMGKHDAPIAQLQKDWGGKAVVFKATADLKPLSAQQSQDTLGGCCGQADEDECLGSCECECEQSFGGSGGGGCGGGGGDGGCGGFCKKSGILSAGSPTWKTNVINMNLIVQDTPIWYEAGRGPAIAFTLTYSNENSNTGIFGPGWRCPFDMKVFFLPSGYPDQPTLQIHRDNGRIETYESNGSTYQPRAYMANYGYQDTTEKLTDGTVIMDLKGGGKYYFMPEGSVAEGRIWKIEDSVGNVVTCVYDSLGNLSQVKDANNRVTSITTTGSGITERVTKVTLPDGRYSDFGYDAQGNLTSIRDMGGFTSTLTYGALAWSDTYNPGTSLMQDVTAAPLVPANGGTLAVYDTYSWPPSGTIRVNGAEMMSYERKGEDGQSLVGIGRGANQTTPAAAPMWSEVTLVSVPYLSTIETPSKKTKFTYEWWTFVGYPRPVVGLHEVFECGGSEQYPAVPTWHYAWCSTGYWTAETRYPTAVVADASGCDQSTSHWTGGLTRYYYIGIGYDSTGRIVDEAGNSTITYGWGGSGTRDPSSLTDANNHTIQYTYDSNHNILSRTDAEGNTLSYTYENDRVKTERDAYNRLVREYFYNALDQVTRIETETDGGARVALVQYFYYPDGRLDYMLDGQAKRTTYRYNENGETRGFLTSVLDPDSKVERYHYDAKGRRDALTDASGKVTTYAYDDLDRITRIIYPDDTPNDLNDNPFVEYVYSCCRLSSMRDPNGVLSEYVFDSKGRLWQTKVGGNVVSTNVYHSQILDRQTAVIDADNHTIAYEYYDNGLAKKITQPDGTWEQYTYDPAGNLILKENGQGSNPAEKWVSYEYDDNNQLIKVCGQ